MNLQDPNRAARGIALGILLSIAVWVVVAIILILTGVIK